MKNIILKFLNMNTRTHIIICMIFGTFMVMSVIIEMHYGKTIIPDTPVVETILKIIVVFIWINIALWIYKVIRSFFS